MKEYLEKTHRFNKRGGQDVANNDIFKVPIEEDLLLQSSLIREELAETIFAYQNKDKEGILDGLVDLTYVVFGMVNRFGLKESFIKAFDRVHESNMGKFCNTIDEAEKTSNYYKTKGIETTITFLEDEDVYVVKRKLDGKILKSINWKEAKLGDLIKDRKEVNKDE